MLVDLLSVVMPNPRVNRYKAFLPHYRRVNIPNFYFPGKKFPSISVTGEHCALSCKHCNGHYLKGMIDCRNPERLTEVAEELQSRGALGFLLSGGCDANGKVPLNRFFPAIKEIKRDTDLKVNLHVGLLLPGDAIEVAETGVDAVSVDVVGASETIREVYGIDFRTDDYARMLEDLTGSGACVIPHITAGLHFGKLKGEEAALEMVEGMEPGTVIVNSLIPTKGTEMENIRVIDDDYLSVLGSAVQRFPNAEVVMGCMRPRSQSVEEEALDIGVGGIVNPGNQTVNTHRHRRIELCCAVPH
jgi:uncharacterized radical SAM superfamily protein